MSRSELKQLVARLAAKPEKKPDANRPKPATPAERVVEQFRNTKTVTAQSPAKSVGQIFRELP